MMQSVLIQSFKGEFEIPEGYKSVTLAVPESILMKCNLKQMMMLEKQMKYLSA